MKLPRVSDDDRQTYQEFAVRMIGRIVFCWFLKFKKSKSGQPLLPEHLLSSEAVRRNENFYHKILEPLFFQTLNTPMKDRIKDLPDGCEQVPFLNGGLFEPKREEDFYDAESRTGNYQNYGLKIPDDWFERFFATLEQYNFTIDENSPTEVEISIDPEILGRIFENLLAEIDPDSGETARKATGSFYTPREIVNYMVDESLIIYLKSKLLGDSDPNNLWKGNETKLEETLRRLFSYAEAENPFDEADTQKLIKAIDDLKILDPACGSGAFPMGVLHRLVFLLGKLDRKNERWKAAQIAKIDRLIKNANDIEDLNLRRKITDDLRQRKAEIEKDFENKEFDFGRKLFLIENCIYGVDIQPIAAEISKLRCFLTLIVDEDVSDDLRNNRGVKPLPNLEFKFVTADALLKLPEAEVQADLFNNDDNEQLAKLGQLRHDYIQSFGEQKKVIKEKFEDIQDDIRRKLNKYGSRENKRALALSNWNPFSHDKVDWFDPLWMFGVKEFDIVIGNPPYVQMQKDGGRLAKLYAKENYQTYERTGDIYCLFYERGYNEPQKLDR
jgi:Eco57I restriction endonuclease.